MKKVTYRGKVGKIQGAILSILYIEEGIDKYEILKRVNEKFGTEYQLLGVRPIPYNLETSLFSIVLRGFVYERSGKYYMTDMGKTYAYTMVNYHMSNEFSHERHLKGLRMFAEVIFKKCYVNPYSHNMTCKKCDIDVRINWTYMKIECDCNE